MSTPEIKQAQGACVAITERGEWDEFSVNVGRQYPVKLSTKQPDIKAKARAAGASMAVWSFTESQGNPNPHKPGQFFINRYLSDVVVGGVLTTPATPAVPVTTTQVGGAVPVTTAGQPTVQMPESDQERRSSIERQSIVKATAHLIPPALIESKERYLELIDELAAWVSHEPAATQPVAGYQHSEADFPAGDDSDDIPF